jgi:shikimate kinase
MGTGKTTVGKLVAKKLGWPFIDADDEIVRQAGMSIPAIFAQRGEAGFREIERDVCRALAGREQVVIATGGGMLVDESNRAVMLESGLVVCLVAPAELVNKRIGSDPNRPLLKTDWRALMEKRKPAYDSIPCQVDTTRKTPDRVAAEIIRLWQTHSASA